MTHQRLGQEVEARQWYDKAATWTKEALAPESEGGTPKPMLTWDQRLTLKLLQSEVSEMLEITDEPTADLTSNPTED